MKKIKRIKRVLDYISSIPSLPDNIKRNEGQHIINIIDKRYTSTNKFGIWSRPKFIQLTTSRTTVIKQKGWWRESMELFASPNNEFIVSWSRELFASPNNEFIVSWSREINIRSLARVDKYEYRESPTFKKQKDIFG